MIRDPEALAQLLEGSVLGERPVTAIPVPGGEEPAFAVDCVYDEVLAAWQAGRAVVDRSGRWPVVVAGWFGGVDAEVFNRFPFDHGAGGDTSISGILRRAEGIDPADVIAELAANDARWDAYDHLVSFELPSTRRSVGDAPLEAVVRAALGAHTTHDVLDRWLLDWEEATGPIKPESAAYLDWFEPSGLDTAVLFLPTEHSWHAPAYLSFFGAEGPGGAEKLIAVVRSWHERFQAELVAHFGTMLELVVGRPPAALDDAWVLAREQELVAPCTTALPGVTLRRHARSLVGRNTWFLHERP